MDDKKFKKTKNSKQKNLKKVVCAIKNCEKYFTIAEIVEKTNLNHTQCKTYLQTMIEFGNIKYSSTSKMYMKNEK